VKTVHVITESGGSGLQSLYLERTGSRLVPDLVFLDQNGRVTFETNSLGLRGPEPDAKKRLGVVWGDSVVFSSTHVRSWPELIDEELGGWTFLNGGIEGSTYTSILERAILLNAQRHVDLNVVLLGWHPFPDNGAVWGTLEESLRAIPRCVLATQPTSLNPAIADTDLRTFFRKTIDREHYGFWTHMPYSVELQREWFDYILERNRIIRAVAHDTKTPLIDLYQILDSSALSDFRTYFFDVGHPREEIYPLLASTVGTFVRALQPPYAA
jgi:hypothetical protein